MLLEIAAHQIVKKQQYNQNKMRKEKYHLPHYLLGKIG
jgi:hypothetical protein